MASTGARVASAVSIANNVVTVNPNADLTASTIYELNILDGAVMQAVDADGNADANGTNRPLEGYRFTFKTAA